MFGKLNLIEVLKLGVLDFGLVGLNIFEFNRAGYLADESF
jgi:hypothetical protein